MKTNRTFTEYKTKKPFALYQNPETHAYTLVYEGHDEDFAFGTTANGFYLNNTGCFVDLKLRDRSFLKLAHGEFLILDPQNMPIYRRMEGKKNFIKY